MRSNKKLLTIQPLSINTSKYNRSISNLKEKSPLLSPSHGGLKTPNK